MKSKVRNSKFVAIKETLVFGRPWLAQLLDNTGIVMEYLLQMKDRLFPFNKGES